MGIIAAMGVGGYLYYYTAVVPMKNKLEEQTAVILAQDLRDQEQKATIVAIQENMEKTATKQVQIFKSRINSTKLRWPTTWTSFADITIAQLASAKTWLNDYASEQRHGESIQ